MEVRTAAGESIHVEMPQERYRELHLAPGVHVFVRPRMIKLFSGNRQADERGGAPRSG